MSGKRTDLRGNSAAARVSRLDMADGGKDKPAKRIGVGGGGTVDEASSVFDGGKRGDKGGGDDARTGEGASTALPLPLSTFGGSSSCSSVASLAVSDAATDVAEATALRWISLNRCAMRSETVAERWGVRASRGVMRGEVV